MSYCRKNNLSDYIENMINHQINVELSAAHTYTALYAYFMNDQQGFPGFAKMFKHSSDDELQHARKFIEYQNIRGGNVRINMLQAPQFFIVNNNTSSLYQAIQFVLNLEQCVYDSILNIRNNCNDSGLEIFLDDFVQEQLKSQFELATLLRKLERIGNDGTGLTLLDNEILKKY